MNKSSNNDEEGAASAASNSNSEEQQQAGNINGSANGSDFQISLNDFLDFLKLSCHVNDMITKVEGKPYNREPVPPAESLAGVFAKRNSKKDEFDFNSLAENELVNGLLGLKRQQRLTSSSSNNNSSRDEASRTSLPLSDPTSSMRTGHIHTDRGLHPKLREQLDYVINEGVLDSVLSFICPMPLPVALTSNGGRGKVNKLQPSQPLQLIKSDPIPSPVNLTTPSSSSPSVHSSRESPAAEIHTGNSVVRASVKEPTGKASTSTGTRRKSLLLVKDSKHSRQDKKEWVNKNLLKHFSFILIYFQIRSRYTRMRWSEEYFAWFYLSAGSAGKQDGLLCGCYGWAALGRDGHIGTLRHTDLWLADALDQEQCSEPGASSTGSMQLFWSPAGWQQCCAHSGLS